MQQFLKKIELIWGLAGIQILLLILRLSRHLFKLGQKQYLLYVLTSAAVRGAVGTPRIP
jgi:hypothetical protein